MFVAGNHQDPASQPVLIRMKKGSGVALQISKATPDPFLPFYNITLLRPMMPKLQTIR
jgi:hypothetical protein